MILKQHPWQALTILIFSALVLANGLVNPRQNWDMIGYTASILHLEGARGAQLHEATYADVRASVDDEKWRELTEDILYRTLTHQDPQFFERQVAFYQGRYLYLATVRALSLFTDTISSAIALTGALAGAVFALLFGGALLGSNWRIFALFPVALLVFQLPKVAALATPDLLAAVAALGIVLCWNKRRNWALALIVLLPLIRTNFIIFITLLMLWQLCDDWVKVRNSQKASPKWEYLAYAGALLSYLMANTLSEHPGYLALFNFIFIVHNTPELLRVFAGGGDIPISAQLSDYWPPYARTIEYILAAWRRTLFRLVLLGVVGYKLIQNFRQGNFWKSENGFLMAAVLFAAAHIVLLHDLSLRFFFFSNVLTALILLQWGAEKWSLRAGR
ncbi:MAG: hypothetical protein ISN29_03830 [Gammaproteobacteria bacterium AqS3]|nr:hypothetical protein [Gammaproteobacteria bacterium AqS3]